MEIIQLAALRTQVGPAADRLGEYNDATALERASRLRSSYPADLVGAALTQARLRGRAGEKFGADAAVMFFTRDGLEQSTRSRRSAGLRAARYAAAGVRRVADLCCGSAATRSPSRGGNPGAGGGPGSAGLRGGRGERRGAGFSGRPDRGPLRRRGGVPLDGCDAVFLDPARRGARGRVFDPDAYSPPWSFAVGLADRFAAAGFKVAPGLRARADPGGDAGAVGLGPGRGQGGRDLLRPLRPSRAARRPCCRRA